MIVSYYLSGIRVKTTQSNINSLGKCPENKVSYFSNNKLDQIFLLVVMIISSINLFSNSMVSHSNSLSSFSTLAVSMDWIHFMAVSVWIGGLFYLSSKLLRNIEPVDYNDQSNSTVTVSDVYNNIASVRNISLFLMNFHL
jgi:copper transport protein